MAQPEDHDDGITSHEHVFINAADGLPNIHPNLVELEEESEDAIEERIMDDLPTSVIVTNIHSETFTDEKMRANMETLFKSFSDTATFQWLRSFRRLRVNFETPTAAALARVQLHQFTIDKSTINCYFAQPVTPVTTRNLQPPAPVKQFLISPPASPPIGWEPCEENEPLVNHDLLAALANLTPGGSHELHPPSDSQPGIVVHTAQSGEVPEIPGKQRIVHTRCPDHK